MDILELDAQLRKTKVQCSGGNCVHTLELPGGVIHTDNFRDYILYNSIRNEVRTATRKDVIEGLKFLGMTREEVQNYGTKKEDTKNLTIGFSTIALVGVVAVIVILLITQK